MTKQTIKINGHHYDASTGTLLNIEGNNSKQKISTKSTPSKNNFEVNRGKTDGVKEDSDKAVGSLKKSSKSCKSQKHKLSPSQTLMRSAVQKPAKLLIHSNNSLVEQKESQNILAPRSSMPHTYQNRMDRAKNIERSRQISRFTPTEKSIAPMSTRYEHIPVKEEPVATNKVQQNVTNTPSRQTNSNDIFAKAIAKSTHHVDVKAHSSAYRRHIRNHFTSMAIGSSALMLIMAFATYLNMPALQFQIAGFKAGISTISPDFKKAGFTYGGLKTEDNKLIVKLEANNTSYSLIEQSTNWDGETMIKGVSSVSASGNPSYRVLYDDSAVIYRLGDGQATWVKNGVWYSINGSKPLSDHQILSLAQNS